MLSGGVKLVGVAGLMLSLSACIGLGDDAPQSVVTLGEAPTWTTGIGQLLSYYCGDCHGAQPADPSYAWFRADVYADGDGRVGAYSLRQRHLARVTDPGRPMPPPPARAMTHAEIEGLRRWVALGAPYDGQSATGHVARCEPSTVGACACPGGYYGGQLCLDDGTFETCGCAGQGVGGNGVPSGAPPAEPVLADVVTWVFEPSCGHAVGCHGPGGAPPDLIQRDGLLARLLVPSLQEPGMARVMPGSTGQSYLYLKTMADFDTRGIGSGRVMPPPESGALASGQATVLQRWIQLGAPE